LYTYLNNLKKSDNIILSDPNTSNLIQSTSNNKVFFLSSGHVNGQAVRIIYNDNIKHFIDNNDLDEYLIKQHVNYIVIDNSLKTLFINQGDIDNSTLMFSKINIGIYSILKLENNN
jgi:hypothetical protein